MFDATFRRLEKKKIPSGAWSCPSFFFPAIQFFLEEACPALATVLRFSCPLATLVIFLGSTKACLAVLLSILKSARTIIPPRVLHLMFLCQYCHLTYVVFLYPSSPLMYLVSRAGLVTCCNNRVLFAITSRTLAGEIVTISGIKDRLRVTVCL